MSAALLVSSGAEVSCVLMAAGKSSRFGSNKLLEPLYGKPVFVHAFDALPPELASRTVVVSGYDEILREGQRRGYTVVRNNAPHEGQARTIRMGLEAAGDAAACMFCVCDQPFVQRASLRKLLNSYRGGAHALSFAGRRGNPVIFAREFYDELRRLPARSGGSWLLRKYPLALSLCECSCARELEDIDTKGSLRLLSGLSNVFFEDETLESVARLLPAQMRSGPARLLSVGSALGTAERQETMQLLDAPEPVLGVFTDAAPWLYEVRARMDTVVGSDMTDKWKREQIARALRHVSQTESCPCREESEEPALLKDF